MIILSALFLCQTGSTPIQDPSFRSTLIEAEAYASCEPVGPRVARRHDMTWASGRTALIGFSAIDEILWNWDSSAEGKRDLWFRYAAKRDIDLRWSISTEGWSETKIESTDLLEGEAAWSWARLGDIDVKKGRHTLRLSGAPLRADCFMLLPADSEAPVWPPPKAANELSPEVIAILKSLPARSLPAWWQDSREITLPSWIEDHRVGLHTRLSVRWTGEEIFTQAEEAVASLGATSLVRHVKAMNGECFWPTAIGAVAPWVEGATQNGLDPVAAMAQRAHEHELSFVAYYRHQEDRPLAKLHPDWVCRDSRGQTIRTAGEPRLCFHSPFGEATLQRMLELAERGADGIYLDESHQPLEGCWCDWTAQAFEGATGLPLPSAPSAKDPLYRRFQNFTEDSLLDELWRWRVALHEVDPEFVLMVSTHRQPDPCSSWPTMRMAAAGDIVKTEFASAASAAALKLSGTQIDSAAARLESILSLGWAKSRDGAFGRPAHVWIHALDGKARWRAAAAAVAASGCVANLDHPEASLPDPASFAGAIWLARQLSVPLAGARPLDEVLLHLPERARNKYLPDQAKAWTSVTAPLLDAWHTLESAHLPARILSDDELMFGMPEATRVLFLPAHEELEVSQQQSVARFREAGGIVVEGEVEALLEAVRTLNLGLTLDLPEHVRAHWFRAGDGALVIGITNRFGWVLDANAAAPEAVRTGKVRCNAKTRSI
ncbi:MAG: hypothetical protein ACI841_003689, partial [Planctomycetota bacterium]